MVKTQFDQIVFDPPSHSYSYHGKILQSATTIVERLKPPFERDQISKRIAEREGKTQAAVLQEWENKKLHGADRGTRVHLGVEDIIANIKDPILDCTNEPIPAMAAFAAMWQRLNVSFQVELIHKEWAVGDVELGVAGRIDALFRFTHRKTGQVKHVIMDWKTGKFEVENRYARLLSPFGDLDDCHLVRYSIQQSLYRLIIDRNTDLNVENCYLVHLRDDGEPHTMRAYDFRQRLAHWLAHGVPDDITCDPIMEQRARNSILFLEDLQGHEDWLTAKTFQRLRTACDQTLINQQSLNSHN